MTAFNCAKFETACASVAVFSFSVSQARALARFSRRLSSSSSKSSLIFSAPPNSEGWWVTCGVRLGLGYSGPGPVVVVTLSDIYNFSFLSLAATRSATNSLRHFPASIAAILAARWSAGLRKTEAFTGAACLVAGIQLDSTTGMRKRARCRYSVCPWSALRTAAVGEFAIGFAMDGFLVQHRFAAVEMFDELGDPARVAEFLLPLRIAPFVHERYFEALVEEGQFPQTLCQGVEVKHRHCHDGGVGFKRNAGAGFARNLAGFGQRRLGNPAGIFLLPGVTIAPDFQLQMFRERVDAAHAHAVKAAGDFIAFVIELAAGMQHGHHHLRGGDAFFFMQVHRDAAAVVHYRYGIVVVDRYVDFRSVACQSFVDGAVDHFITEVMQTCFAARADVHGGAQTHRLQALEHFDACGIVDFTLYRAAVVCHILLAWNPVGPLRCASASLRTDTDRSHLRPPA